MLRRPPRDSDTDSLHSVRSEPNLSARSDSSSSSSSYAKNDVFRKVSVGQVQAKKKKLNTKYLTLVHMFHQYIY